MAGRGANRGGNNRRGGNGKRQGGGRNRNNRRNNDRRSDPMGKKNWNKNNKKKKPAQPKEKPATAEDLDDMMAAYWAKGNPEVAAKHLDSAMDEYFAKKKDSEEAEGDDGEKKAE